MIPSDNADTVSAASPRPSVLCFESRVGPAPEVG